MTCSDDEASAGYGLGCSNGFLWVLGPMKSIKLLVFVVDQPGRRLMRALPDHTTDLHASFWPGYE